MRDEKKRICVCLLWICFICVVIVDNSTPNSILRTLFYMYEYVLYVQYILREGVRRGGSTVKQTNMFIVSAEEKNKLVFDVLPMRVGRLRLTGRGICPFNHLII